VLTEYLLNCFNPCFDACLISGCTVLPQEIFKDIGRDYGVAFDNFDEILADNESLKVCGDFLV
jgi:hypothetical protein